MLNIRMDGNGSNQNGSTNGNMNDNEIRPSECGCLDQLPLAIAYVPFQRWSTPYEAPVALNRGTIFPQLDKPFIGEEAVSNG